MSSHPPTAFYHHTVHTPIFTNQHQQTEQDDRPVPFPVFKEKVDTAYEQFVKNVRPRPNNKWIMSDRVKSSSTNLTKNGIIVANGDRNQENQQQYFGRVHTLKREVIAHSRDKFDQYPHCYANGNSMFALQKSKSQANISPKTMNGDKKDRNYNETNTKQETNPNSDQTNNPNLNNSPPKLHPSLTSEQYNPINHTPLPYKSPKKHYYPLSHRLSSPQTHSPIHVYIGAKMGGKIIEEMIRVCRLNGVTILKLEDATGKTFGGEKVEQDQPNNHSLNKLTTHTNTYKPIKYHTLAILKYCPKWSTIIEWLEKQKRIVYSVKDNHSHCSRNETNSKDKTKLLSNRIDIKK